ncbi:MAG TPA: NmrA family NAD(P)-binding protein [Nitriliruptorales bacterium]|nr:NmrA family NAD(P)-binding protein [Nitriliruptorales bacterium]
MPVLVTAAGTTLGREIVRLIGAGGGEVRAYCGPGAPLALLRQAGAICATGSLLDEGHLETAMEQAHTVVHLAVRLDVDDPRQLVEETATVVTAAIGARVRRVIALSLPWARARPDPVRAAAAEAEDLVASVICPSTVVRTSLVDTAELRAALERVPLDRATLERPVAPVLPGDVARVVAWLDAERDRGQERHATLAADGPRTLPLGDYLGRVGVSPPSLVGRMADRVRSDRVSSTLRAALGGPWTSGPEVPDAWDRTGVSPRPPWEQATR